MSRYDAVVVGGRVAGASTALLLARSGARVAVVERGNLDRDPVSTHALMRAGVLQLSRWGVLDAVVAAGTPPVSNTVFWYPDGGRQQVSIRSRHGVHALFAPRRTLLDRLLLDAAAAAGAEVHLRTGVAGLQRTAAGRVSGVVVRTPSGATRSLDADLTVGADGLRSVVAAEVGAPVLREGRSASAVLYRYVHGLPTAGYEWVYGHRSAAGLIPTNDDATCVFVSTTPAHLRSLRRGGVEDAFWRLLEAGRPGLADRVRRAGPRGAVRGWRGARGRVRRSAGAGWALVGDAGRYQDPITTHGITDALRDAELLSDAVLTTLGGGPDSGRALAAYQETRDRLSEQLWVATEEVASYQWDDDRVRSLLRAVSASMSDEVEYLAGLGSRQTLVPASAAGIPPDNHGWRR
jgi:2-polyprenyl-6-methoxyphenol hydroxylase-like FAD-dependent oxidoreductase